MGDLLHAIIESPMTYGPNDQKVCRKCGAEKYDQDHND